MPYIFKEELEEGEEQANVIPIEDYKNLESERDVVVNQRDEALSKMESLKKELLAVKQKYADALLPKDEPKKIEPPKPPVYSNKVFSFNDLF